MSLSITQAAAQGIHRLRLPVWSNPLDHLKIDVIDGKPGPWLHLFCPFNKELNGRDPVDILIFQYGDPNAEGFEAYTGLLPESDEYKTAAAAFDGCMTADSGAVP